MNERDVLQEIRNFISESCQSGAQSTDWLQQQLVNRHTVRGEIGSDYALTMAHGHTRTLLGRVLRDMKSVETDDQAQTAFPPILGFERLQPLYLVRRGGDSMVVPIGETTDEELLQKARDARKQGMGHLRHAEELEAFVEARREKRARA